MAARFGGGRRCATFSPMSTLSVTQPKADAERLVEPAAREGATPEQVALAAVRARLEADAAWCGEVAAGLAELDAGVGMTLADFEREMDAFVAQSPAARG